MYLNGMAVSWTAKKQGGVSLSTIKAEFVAASEVAHELMGVHQMLGEVDMALVVPISMHVKNPAAISQINAKPSPSSPNISMCGTSICVTSLDAVSSRRNTFDPS